MKKFFLLLLGAASLGACKKDSETTPNAVSKTDLLTAKNWRVSAASATIAGVPFPGVVEACSMDDFLKFSTNKSLLHDEGATKCDSSDPQTGKGTWDMPSDAKLTVVLPNSDYPSGTFDIKELSATTLHLYTTQTVNGVVTTSDLTFTAF